MPRPPSLGTPSGILFAAINFYHRLPLVGPLVLPAMEARARARGLSWLLDSSPGLTRVDQRECVEKGTFPPLNASTKMCGQLAPQNVALIQKESEGARRLKGDDDAATVAGERRAADAVCTVGVVTCYSDPDPGQGRIMANNPFAKLHQLPAPVSLEACSKFCWSLNLTVAGVEYANECYCGTGVHANATKLAGGCTMRCQDGHGERCGGSYQLGVYAVNCTGTKPPPPPPPPGASVSKFKSAAQACHTSAYAGCTCVCV